MPFQPGQSGNPGGGNKRPWAAALDRALARATDDAGTPDYPALNRIASKVVELALDGDKWAIEEIACRKDGRPLQNSNVQMVVSGNLISKEQSLLMAEATIESARLASAGAGESHRLHDSGPAGLPTSSPALQDS